MPGRTYAWCRLSLEGEGRPTVLISNSQDQDKVCL